VHIGRVDKRLSSTSRRELLKPTANDDKFAGDALERGYDVHTKRAVERFYKPNAEKAEDKLEGVFSKFESASDRPAIEAISV